MGHTEENTRVQDEKKCIEIFLNWHNRRFKTHLNYQRAEDVFPEIGKLLRSINNRLANQFQGEFLILGVPRLQLERQKRAELKRILSELILKNINSLKSDAVVDLGSQILRRFKEWPSTPHLNTNLSPPIEYRVNADSCFTLYKISNTGCSLELGAAQSAVFRFDQAFLEALTSLFTKGEMSQANSQLNLAKEKGAKSTILLMDCHLPSWYPNHVRQVLADNENSSQLADVDCIYLVKASENRVSQVWGKGQKLINAI
jgi:hypothetical protein